MECMGGRDWSSRRQRRQRASVCRAACRSIPLEVRLSLPNTPNGTEEDFRWFVGALGSAHAAENRGRQHRSSRVRLEYWPGRLCTGRAPDADEEGLAYRQASAVGCGTANKRRKRQTRTIYKYKALNRCLQSAAALCLILRFPIRYRLPLHGIRAEHCPGLSSLVWAEEFRLRFFDTIHSRNGDSFAVCDSLVK